MNWGQEHMAKQRENMHKNKHTQPAHPELAEPASNINEVNFTSGDYTKTQQRFTNYFAAPFSVPAQEQPAPSNPCCCRKGSVWKGGISRWSSCWWWWLGQQALGFIRLLHGHAPAALAAPLECCWEGGHIPKSAIFAFMCASSSTFSGFRSLCTTMCLWQ